MIIVSLYLLLLLIKKKAAHRPSETFLLICVHLVVYNLKNPIAILRDRFFKPCLHFTYIQHVVHVSKRYFTCAFKPNSSKALVPICTVSLQM